MASHHIYKAAVKKLAETGEVEIKSAISAEEFAGEIAAAAEEIRKEITLPGFRKGFAPEKLVREKVGEAAILHEAAERAIAHAYGHILEAEKIDAIGHPQVSITKIASGNPLEFTIVTAVVPEIGTLDYTAIAKKENGKKEESQKVTDEEVNIAIEKIQRNSKREKAPAEDADAKLPELTDEMVKTWGEFTGVADFKSKLRENLQAEKDHKAKEKKRLELVEALTKDLEVAVPEVLVVSELGRMTEQMKHDIERMGLKFDDYLKHLKKSEAELQKEWRPDAIKRVKLDLAIAHIAKKEKITADKEKVEAEVKHAKEHHKDVDAEKARSYFSHIFQNQAVFEFLERQ